ncbi:hypothetical protein AUJ65_00670 [Candidatus Micrarchaeota archaeon CG1_02_51_15]|nr:MAG: hypothetical protein AUJ65_00670 [Candidatus Micrarchaeota archaeon CG1_02_51_15]
MNVNLGAPYEAVINRLIERGYAGNQTEIIRQALVVYAREIDEEEAHLVHKAVGIEVARMKSGATKTYSYEELMRKAGLKP